MPICTSQDIVGDWLLMAEHSSSWRIFWLNQAKAFIPGCVMLGLGFHRLQQEVHACILSSTAILHG